MTGQTFQKNITRKDNENGGRGKQRRNVHQGGETGQQREEKHLTYQSIECLGPLKGCGTQRPVKTPESPLS